MRSCVPTSEHVGRDPGAAATRAVPAHIAAVPAIDDAVLDRRDRRRPRPRRRRASPGGDIRPPSTGPWPAGRDEERGDPRRVRERREWVCRTRSATRAASTGPRSDAAHEHGRAGAQRSAPSVAASARSGSRSSRGRQSMMSAGSVSAPGGDSSRANDASSVIGALMSTANGRRRELAAGRSRVEIHVQERGPRSYPPVGARAPRTTSSRPGVRAMSLEPSATTRAPVAPIPADGTPPPKAARRPHLVRPRGIIVVGHTAADPPCPGVRNVATRQPPGSLDDE